jgi:HEAT repeat protein
MIAAAPIVVTLNILSPPITLAAGDASDSPQSLLAIITSKTSTETQRQIAAVQLLEQNTDEARQKLQTGLQKESSADGRLAIARGIATIAKPDPRYISGLSALLGPNLTQTKAAAHALSNYRGDAQAFSALKSFVDNTANPTDSRAAVVVAIGELIDKEPANYLVQLVAATNQSDEIRKRAAAALAEMTGISSYGASGQKWQQWWASVSGQTAEQFHAMLLVNRGREAAHLNQLEEQTGLLLKAYYYSLSDEEKKTSLVLKYLDDPSPVIRAKVFTLFTDAPPSDTVKDKLVEMIDDPDSAVRQSVAGVLGASNYAKAIPRLIARLKTEKDAPVKAAIATALGKSGDVSAGREVGNLLNDSDQQVVIAAAGALAGSLGVNLSKSDTVLTADLTGTLKKIVKDNDAVPGTEEMRAACLSAIAALGDPSAVGFLFPLIQPNQPAEVRKAALAGLGTLGSSDVDQGVLQQLDPKTEHDPSIRLEAAKAMGSVARREDDDAMFRAMQNEPVQAVKTAEWVSFQKLYDRLTVGDLQRWADAFNKPPSIDPAKRLATLLKLNERLKASGQPEDLAKNQLDLANAMMAVTPRQTEGAIENMKAALAYWRGPGNGGPSQIEELVGDLLDDYLEARQYSEATAFAAEQIKIAESFQSIVGPRIKNKAARLADESPADARALVDLALKMNPPLKGSYLDQVQMVQDKLKAAGH